MSLYNKAMNGEISAMDAYIELYEAKVELDKQLDDLKELARLERERYGKEEVMRNGWLIELASGRKQWSYKGVSAWNSVKARLTEIEKMAQMAFNGAEVTDKETGEVVEPAELSFTKDTIKLTYKGQ
jgi:hypothetical protein